MADLKYSYVKDCLTLIFLHHPIDLGLHRLTVLFVVHANLSSSIQWWELVLKLRTKAREPKLEIKQNTLVPLVCYLVWYIDDFCAEISLAVHDAEELDVFNFWLNAICWFCVSLVFVLKKKTEGPSIKILDDICMFLSRYFFVIFTVSD
jgi:hypothetical protein